MFNRYQILDNDGEKSLYLYVDFTYEFSIDFSLKGKKGQFRTLQDKIINYIKDKRIDFNKGKVFIVAGGIIIGTLILSNFQYNNINNNEPKYTYVEHVDLFEESLKDMPSVIKETNDNKEVITTEKVVIEIPKVVEKETPKVEKSIVEPKVIEEKPVVEAKPVVEVKPIEETKIETNTNEQTVTLYRYNGTVEQIALEDYVIGVVSAEMPALFNAEALKAQSVVARTYALKKMDSNQVLKDDTSNQVYKDINQLKGIWGNRFDEFYNKIKNAVNATKGETLTYNNKYIEALYHSTSNGYTEDSVAVWGNSYPYLKSVDSHWDLNASSYLRETEKEFNIISTLMGLDFNEQTNIEVISRTNSNRINEIKINDTIYKGTEVRSLLGLRSTDFDIRFENGKAVFTTRGYGHGVGMSQYGANGMANEGYNYQQILAHYYPNTNLKN